MELFQGDDAWAEDGELASDDGCDGGGGSSGDGDLAGVDEEGRLSIEVIDGCFGG